MRVGITAQFQFSVFSGGGSISTLAVAEALKIMGHDVTLINLNGTQEWWDDLPSLKQVYPRVNVADIKEPFDIVLEVTGNLPDRETRLRVGKKCVWVIRKPVLIDEIEHTIFPVSLGKRNLDGICAVWAFDQQVFDDERQYLETLTRVPVRYVPFVWTPSVVEIHRKETGMPAWIQITVHMTQQAQKVLPWSVHICETNNSATSSCTIPLVGLRETKRQGQFFFSKYKIHNSQPVQNSEFFKQNVLAHCQIQDLSGEFLGRQRVVDMSVDPMSCILAHLRFRRVRPFMLDALWCGIPLVHNSTLIKDLGSGYENYYYEDNSITGIAKALLQVQNDLHTAQGMFKQGAYMSLQQKILERYSPISVFVQEGWRSAIDSLRDVSVPAPLSFAPTLAIPVVPPSTESAVSTTAVDSGPTTFRVLFTDMWDDFNPEYNMFLLILKEGSKQLNPRPTIVGYSPQTLPPNEKPNILIFGPFGSEWRKESWKDIPKAHYTGENTAPITEGGVFLNMGYPHADFVDERYIRLPLWMLEIDWFGADLEQIKNPKPLPLDRCLKVYPEEIPGKQRFCAFVVTNPCNPVRNAAFHWLSQYKQVDSAGRLFNNIGDEIFAGLGGGGGELKKHEFLKKYKFCLAYENSSSQGYTTEKLLHAKIAGCIPIYWGDPKVERDFDTKGFIDARSFTSPEELVEAVRKIDTDEAAYKKMFSVPALDEYKRDLVRRSLSQIAYMMLRAGLPKGSVKQEQIPRFLGAANSNEAAALREEREGSSPAPVHVSVALEAPSPNVSKGIRLMSEPKDANTALPSSPLIVSMASLRFLPSLHQMLAALAAQKKAVGGLEARIWLAKDVPESAEKTLRESFTFASFLRLPESEIPDGFADYWEPQHFAWKIWIYHTLSQDKSLDGRLILYMDSGIFMCRWPKAWLQIVTEEGICALHDPRETNGRWCHDVFCKALQVTDEEKASNQIIAGCLAFIGGNDKARRLFAEAYEWSKKREVIVGAKWEGVRDGKPFGHRHDQSILSILTQRLDVARYPLDNIYCDHSLRKTFLSGKALYVHRGAFTLHKQFSKEIDDAFVINLDRRADRMEKMFSANPELKDRVTRFSAYDGKQLKLTPTIARLFKPHDFFWKKAIMGCALSHLSLWWQLVNERPEIDTYLIMEDDCKLQPGWEDKWNAAAGHIPEDADVVYLGGILPPNRRGFETVKERVNEFFSRVAPNQFFGQRVPNRYFHWCNYAYILTRRGAEKVLKILMENNGYWTSADHMVCNRVDVINHYFLDPLVAGCYQDDDPKYQASAFNDFSRVDGFDSDLWNNDERFSSEEVEAMLKESGTAEIDIAKALDEGRKGIVLAPKAAVETKQEDVIGKSNSESDTVHLIQSERQKEALRILREWKQDNWSQSPMIAQLVAALPNLRRSQMPSLDPPLGEVRALLTKWREQLKPTNEAAVDLWKQVETQLQAWSACSDILAAVPKEQTRCYVTLEQHDFKGESAYEKEWIQELIGKELPFVVKKMKPDEQPPCENPIVIVQRPHIEAYTALFQRWEAQKIPFYVFHVSDEYVTDNISFYELSMCKGVVRMYNRSDIPASVKQKVKVIPLGYHWTTSNSSDDPLNKTPRLPFRNNVWSFYGTGWQNRAALLAPLTQIGPHLLKLMDSWESPEKLTHNQYIAILLDSIFVPCPGGNNIETFRLYEALECGCIPLYVKTQGDDAYIEMLQNEIGILPVSSWQEAAVLMIHFMKEKEIMENYRNSLLTRWRLWKQRLSEDMKRTWSL